MNVKSFVVEAFGGQVCPFDDLVVEFRALGVDDGVVVEDGGVLVFCFDELCSDFEGLLIFFERCEV